MRDLVIFDLDDTLALTEHRAHHLLTDPVDWSAYVADCHKDAPNEVLLAVFYDHFVASRDMWIVTARSDEVREQTEDWLYNNGCYYNRLIMRAAGDERSGADVKLRWLHDGTIPHERVLCAYDNESQVIDLYRALGITCFHVLSGNR